MEIFNNREIALGIWIAIFIIFVFLKPSTRKPAIGLVKSAFAWKLSFTYASALIYVTAIVYLLFRLGLWDRAQLKDTILWMLTVGSVNLFDITREDKNNYFKDTLKKIFKLTIILEFLVGFYTFNLSLELLIIPLVILISGLLAVGKKEEKFKPAVKFLNNVLSLLGLFLIGYTIYKIIHDFSSFANKETASEFLIPPPLSFLFLPFVYVLSLLVNLESIFIGVKSELKSKRLVRYARWQVLLRFNFNKIDTNRWRQLVFARHPRTKNDVLESIKLIKRLKEIEKNPPEVPFNVGWSPYMAKSFLMTQGVTTKFYQPIYGDEWQASSPSIDLKDSILSSNVHYYVEGNDNVAKKLILELNVYSHEGAKMAHAKFLTFAQSLYLAALEKAMPHSIEDAILKGNDKEIEIGDKRISLIKNKWAGHKLNGYEMEFVIQI
jgi:hypothetical protein